MSIIIDVQILSTDFLFEGLLSEHPDIRIHLERVIPTAESLLPNMWISGLETEEVDQELSNDPAVEEITVIDKGDEMSLVRIEWTDEVNEVVKAMSDTGITVLEGEGMGDSWNFTLRFSDQDVLSRFNDRCLESGIKLHPQRIQVQKDPESVPKFGLTDIQRETLLEAYQTGYFEIPRRMSLQMLADQIGISDSATSQRLRRGISSLVENVLLKSAGE